MFKVRCDHHRKTLLRVFFEFRFKLKIAFYVAHILQSTTTLHLTTSRKKMISLRFVLLTSLAVQALAKLRGTQEEENTRQLHYGHMGNMHTMGVTIIVIPPKDNDTDEDTITLAPVAPTPMPTRAPRTCPTKFAGFYANIGGGIKSCERNSDCADFGSHDGIEPCCIYPYCICGVKTHGPEDQCVEDDGSREIIFPLVTSAPVTTAPITNAPVTSAPVTSSPITFAPVTAAPVTVAPVTSSPVTEAPVTPAPTSSCYDFDSRRFWATDAIGYGTCPWLREQTRDLRLEVCAQNHPRSAFFVCRKTCKQCSDVPTPSPTIAAPIETASPSSRRGFIVNITDAPILPANDTEAPVTLVVLNETFAPVVAPVAFNFTDNVTEAPVLAPSNLTDAPVASPTFRALNYTSFFNETSAPVSTRAFNMSDFNETEAPVAVVVHGPSSPVARPVPLTSAPVAAPTLRALNYTAFFNETSAPVATRSLNMTDLNETEAPVAIVVHGPSSPVARPVPISLAPVLAPVAAPLNYTDFNETTAPVSTRLLNFTDANETEAPVAVVVHGPSSPIARPVPITVAPVTAPTFQALNYSAFFNETSAPVSTRSLNMTDYNETDAPVAVVVHGPSSPVARPVPITVAPVTAPIFQALNQSAFFVNETSAPVSTRVLNVTDFNETEAPVAVVVHGPSSPVARPVPITVAPVAAPTFRALNFTAVFNETSAPVAIQIVNRTEAPVAAPVSRRGLNTTYAPAAAPVVNETYAPIAVPVAQFNDTGAPVSTRTVDETLAPVAAPVSVPTQMPSEPAARSCPYHVSSFYQSLTIFGVETCEKNSDCSGWTDDGFRRCCLYPQCICGKAIHGGATCVPE